jgi:hypothetical protein
MATEIMTEIVGAVFVLGLPLWLTLEEMLHRVPARAQAERTLELRRPARQTVAADRAPRTA